MFRSINLSRYILIESIIILIFCFLLVADYFSSHHILDLFIHFEPSETLLVEENSPNDLLKVRIYKIDSLSLYSLSVRVDFITNKDSKIYSYYTYVNDEDMPDDNQYYSVQWENNIPYIYISGNPTISITHEK